jgi:hypothetical protein
MQGFWGGNRDIQKNSRIKSESVDVGEVKVNPPRGGQKTGGSL